MRRSVVDVAVVGAGPVGATLVALLANRLVQNHSRKLKVALLDANPKALHKMQSLDRSVPPDPRVLAVSANTKKLWQGAAFSFLFS
jgi:2-polyprenyl-6-methoxyphenol hydroxylase-like FAD-dependent oxidoreductase